MRIASSILLLAFLVFTDGAKVLIFSPRFGHSHSQFLGRIADILTEEGHNVTTLISILDEGGKDYTEKSTKVLIQTGTEAKKAVDDMNSHKVGFFDVNPLSAIGTYFAGTMMGKLFAIQCEEVLAQEKVLEKLRQEHFDIYLTETFDMCGVGLFEVVKAKTLVVASAAGALFGEMYDTTGVPRSVSFNPAISISKFDAHSIFSRAINLYGTLLSHYFFQFGRDQAQELFAKKYGPEFPKLFDIESRAAYVFTNDEPLIGSAIPTLNRVIPVGGLGAKEPAKLSKEWEEVMTRRAKTVLLSFGSVAQSHHLRLEVKQALLTTVKAFPDVTFIWKYEVDDDFTKNVASKVKNLYLTKWMPQNDLLNHKNMAAFITHGGGASTQETARRGVPGIFIPLFGDQPRNAYMMEYSNLGKVYDKFDVEQPEKLISVVKEVLENPRYRELSQKTARMIAKKPFTPRELLVKYVAFAAEFGASPALRPQSIDMSFIEVNNLDIIFLTAVVLVTFLYVSHKLVAKCFGKHKKEKQQ